MDGLCILFSSTIEGVFITAATGNNDVRTTIYHENQTIINMLLLLVNNDGDHYYDYDLL